MSNNVNFFKINKPILQPNVGRVLVAEPSLDVDYFKRSVVLLTECDGINGTAGFVLNKVIELPLNVIIDNFNCSISQVGVGGPVDSDSLYFIHTLGFLIPDSQHIFGSIYWGGDFNVLSQLFYKNEIDESQVRFFLGYAGWSKGQLEDEILQNTWVVLDLDDQHIMRYSENLWHKAVEKLGENYKLWLNYPEDPQLN